jgi:hypothetical protein
MSELKPDEISLARQVEILNNKVDDLSTKIDSIERSSQTIVKHSEELRQATNQNHVFNAMRGELYDPSGFLSKEMTNYLFNTIQRYENTDFRKWLATRGKKVVEMAIDDFIDSRLPQLSWYGATIRHVEGDDYSYSAHTSFPFEIDTGMPLIGKLVLTRVNVKIDSKVNSSTKQIKDICVDFSSAEPQQGLYEMLEDEIEYTLRPHKTAYSILSPIGRNIKNFWLFLRKETSFSIPFALLFLITMSYPTTPPGYQIYALTGFFLGGLRFFNWYLGAVFTGILNGVMFGVVVWYLFKHVYKKNLFRTSEQETRV